MDGHGCVTCISSALSSLGKGGVEDASRFELWELNGRRGVVYFVIALSTQCLKGVDCREEQDIL